MTGKSLVHQTSVLQLAAIRLRGDDAAIASASAGPDVDVRDDDALSKWIDHHGKQTTFLADVSSALLKELDTNSNLQACDAVLSVLYAARDICGVPPEVLLKAAVRRGPQAISAGPGGL